MEQKIQNVCLAGPGWVGRGNDVPSIAQMRVAYSLLKESPLSATGKLYEKTCKDARSNGDPLMPAFRCSGPIFGRISECVGTAVVHDLHRQLTSKNKNAARWACLAEDSSKGFEQMCLRVAFKDYSAQDVLLDWKRHGGKKKASSHMLHLG